MPWELSIVRPDGAPLGAPAAVQKEISRHWAGVVWGREPSLLEKIRHVPDHPFHQLIPTWPEELRRNAERSKTIGVCDAGGVFVEMYVLEGDPIRELHVEIRGSGDPSPLLIRLSRATAWGFQEKSSGKLLDGPALAAAWAAFQAARPR